MRRLRALSFAALLVGALATACGDLTDSTGPADARRSGLGLPGATVSAAFTSLGAEAKAKAVRWGGSHVQMEERVSAVVGPDGGSLALPGSDFAMTIPAGALSDSRVITVTSKGGVHVAYDMQPHGLVFLKPVTIVQQLRNTAIYGTGEARNVRSAFLPEGQEEIAADDSASPAELAAGATLYYGTDVVAETHIWYLNHFSRYILISGVLILEEE